MKKFIDSLQLRLSDLFLFIGFLCFAIYLIFGQEFMQHPNPNEVALPLWAAIICFVGMVGAWGAYLYLEMYVRKTKFNPIIASCFAVLILLNVIAIFVQPENSTEAVTIRMDLADPTRVGQVETALLYVSGTHKFVFISELVGTGVFMYIGLFIFPKRLTNMKFIEYLGYALFVFLGVLILYSYIFEYNNYIEFFKYVLGIDRSYDLIDHCSVKSFIIHRNAYGMCMMLGIIFCFINQSIKQRKWYYPLAGFFYLNMIFSVCKTGLLLSALICLIYFVYRSIVTFKEHKKRNIIALSVVGGIVVIAGAVAGLSLLTEGKVFGKIYEIVDTIAHGGNTLNTRSYIWDNSYQLLSNGWWLLGRGFGTINLQLMPMNILSHGERVFPTHSAWVNMVAEGGILLLIAYVIFLGYVSYVIYKSYKKSPDFIFAVALGALVFFLYSFIETIQYLMYVFLFPIFVIYFQTEKEEAQELEKGTGE